MKCDKCGAPVTFLKEHPIGMPPIYVTSEIEQLRPKLKDKDERIKELEAENKQLLELSENLDEHPEGYEGPCLCKLCKSYG